MTLNLICILMRIIIFTHVLECEPVKFWLLARHGTRNPGAKGIEQLRELVDVSWVGCASGSMLWGGLRGGWKAPQRF